MFATDKTPLELLDGTKSGARMAFASLTCGSLLLMGLQWLETATGGLWMISPPHIVAAVGLATVSVPILQITAIIGGVLYLSHRLRLPGKFTITERMMKSEITSGRERAGTEGVLGRVENSPLQNRRSDRQREDSSHGNTLVWGMFPSK